MMTTSTLEMATVHLYTIFYFNIDNNNIELIPLANFEELKLKMCIWNLVIRASAWHAISIYCTDCMSRHFVQFLIFGMRNSKAFSSSFLKGCSQLFRSMFDHLLLFSSCLSKSQSIRWTKRVKKNVVSLLIWTQLSAFIDEAWIFS